MRSPWMLAMLLLTASWHHVDSVPQFHLSLVGDASDSATGVDYMLDWVTPATASASTVVFGSSPSNLTRQAVGKAAGLVEESASSSVACWSALLPRVRRGNTVYYALQDDPSAVYSFAVPSANNMTWVIFGDLAAPMQNGASAVSWPALTNDVNHGLYQGFLNLGDIAYELSRENGRNYMEALENITSKVPMQITIGNHEHEHQIAPMYALQNYRRRFMGTQLGAGAASGSNSSEYFSFSSGLIHFVLLNTEVYGDEAFYAQSESGTWAPSEPSRRQTAKEQAAWLEYDLSRVNRTATPYVVVGGHRPPFKTPLALSKKGNMFAQEIVPLLDKYHVDLYVSGHEHTYVHFEASTFDKYQIPPIIISGSPGNLEYVRPIQQIDTGGFKLKTNIPKYGYGFLTATDKALEWKWGSTGSDGGPKPKPTPWTLQDQVTIPRQNLPCCTTPAGTPVQKPAAVEPQWGVNASSDPDPAPGTPGSSKKSAATHATSSLLIVVFATGILQAIAAQ